MRDQEYKAQREISPDGAGLTGYRPIPFYYAHMYKRNQWLDHFLILIRPSLMRLSVYQVARATLTAGEAGPPLPTSGT